MLKLNGWKIVCIVITFCAATTIVSAAQIFTTLARFDPAVGNNPIYGSLAQGTDGNFYGMTSSGGPNTRSCTGGCGTIFKITTQGTLTDIYSFCAQINCADGYAPFSSLVLGTDGNLYGLAYHGGLNNAGTIFKVTPAGEFSTLHQFCKYLYLTFCLDGEFPETAMIQASNGNFYGTTSEGGSRIGNYGSAFEISPAGEFAEIHAFCVEPGCEDGNIPNGLLQGTDGNLYGTTSYGGLGNAGTVFRMTADGIVTTLYAFCRHFGCLDGARPWGNLVQATDGNFYGTAVVGGKNTCTQGCGTIFKITPQGDFSLFYVFCTQPNCADGFYPFAGLVQGTDGNLYGTASAGGANLATGTIFKITLAGTLTTLYNFCSQPNCADGITPNGGLVQGTDGKFYGMATAGGGGQCKPYGCGTVYSLDVGLGPFVSFVRGAAKQGQQFGILGQGLIGTSSVSLNGTPASFRVESGTLLIATVPDRATSGYVTVTTPGGKLTSNVPFQVIP